MAIRHLKCDVQNLTFHVTPQVHIHSKKGFLYNMTSNFQSVLHQEHWPPQQLKS